MNNTLLTRNDTDIDRCWIMSAQRNRHPIKVYTYHPKENATTIQIIGASNSSNRVDKVDKDDRARHALMRACNYLHTNYPGIDNKRKRDFLIVDDADSLYFIGKFSTGKERLQVKCDEAWIVEMFFDKMLAKGYKHHFPIYIFTEQKGVEGWSQLQYFDQELKKPIWIKTLPPRPKGNYIGIGYKYLSENIKTEISLF